MKEKSSRAISYLHRLGKNADARTTRATFKISPEVVDMAQMISGQGRSFNAKFSEEVSLFGIFFADSMIDFSEVCKDIKEIKTFEGIKKYSKADTSSDQVNKKIELSIRFLSSSFTTIDLFNKNFCSSIDRKSNKIKKTYAISINTKKMLEFIAESINLNKSETFEFIIKYLYHRDYTAKVERAKKRYPVLLKMKNETSKLFAEIKNVEKRIEALWDAEELYTEPEMNFGMVRILNTDEDYIHEGLEPIDVAINNIFCLEDEYHQYFHSEFLEALRREEKILVDAGLDLDACSKEGDQS